MSITVTKENTRASHKDLWDVCNAASFADKRHIQETYINTGLMQINRTVSSDRKHLTYELVFTDATAKSTFDADPVVIAIRAALPA